jgi:hypothetical protein
MEHIELATPEGPVDAVVVSPGGRGPWPGVVVVHDMISATSGGLPGIIGRVAVRIAKLHRRQRAGLNQNGPKTCGRAWQCSRPVTCGILARCRSRGNQSRHAGLPVQIHWALT